MGEKSSKKLSNGLQAFDFVPKNIKPDSLLHWPQFEGFSTLLGPINDFLRQNPAFSVKTCETVHFLVEKDHVKDQEKSSYIQIGESLRPFVKAARIWVGNRGVTRSNVPEGYAEQIGYVTFVPELHKDAAKTLADLTGKINDYLRANPLPGKILAVESLQMKGVKEGELNVDSSCWKPTWSLAQLQEGCLSMFRIWYRLGPPQYETVGFADFFPNPVGEPADWLTKPTYQLFPEVLQAVETWAHQIPGSMSITNVNTVSTRMHKTGGPVDTYSTFQWADNFHKYHLRFLRVAFVVSAHVFAGPPAYDRRRITSRLFAPALIADPTWRKQPKFEPQAFTKERLDQWIGQTGATVLGLQTIPYKTRTAGELLHGFDAMSTWNETHYNNNTKQQEPSPEQYVICYRLLIDGDVADPPNFPWPRSIVDYNREHGGGCSIS